MIRAVIILAGAALATAGSLQAKASDPAASPLKVIVSECQTRDANADAPAATLAERIRKAFSEGDRKTLLRLVPDMEAVMESAPPPVYLERCANGVTVYSSNIAAALSVGTTALADDTSDTGKNLNLAGPTPYATIAFALGWAYADRKDYIRCVMATEDGLKRDPFDEAMIAEYLFCLSMAGRNEETVARADDYLGYGLLVLTDTGKAAVLRRKGYALIELGRLDDAEAAYTASLELDGESANAKSQIDYIKERKKARDGR